MIEEEELIFWKPFQNLKNYTIILKINKGEPWLMWPDILVANFIDFPANKIFDYDGNFKFKMIFKTEEKIEKRSTLFSKLPSYFGVDFDQNYVTLILTDNTKDSKYLQANFSLEPNKITVLEINKIDNNITLSINDEVLISHEIIEKLARNNESHIIFGSGNFPQNGFNLNYFSFILEYLLIEKDNEIIAEHTFEKYIHNKSFDLTGNCNFIHKI
jgi:hypothetical protein